jgi:hypothetical protein
MKPQLRSLRDTLLHVKAMTAHARDLNQTRAREAEARAESAEAELVDLRKRFDTINAMLADSRSDHAYAYERAQKAEAELQRLREKVT